MDLFLDRLRSAISRDPEAVAFLGRGGGLRYRDVRSLVGSAMRLLDAQGVRPGRVVGLNMPQSPLHLVAFFALARLGAITLPLPWNEPDEERAHIAKAFGASLVVSGRADGGAPGLPLVLLDTLSARGDEDGLDAWPFVPRPETPVRIALTSGTVGERKGLDHTHGYFSARIARGGYVAAAAPRVMPSRLHVNAALQAALHALCSNGAVVFPARYDTPGLLEAATRFAVTHLMMPPVHAANLAAMIANDTPALPLLVQLRLVGGTASPSVIAAIQRRITRNVYGSYSTTETGNLALSTPETFAAFPGAAGRVRPDVTLEVVDEGGNPVAPGVTGEIRVRVAGMPSGYHGAVHAERFRGGWFHPNDRGRVTAEGIVYVEGRVDDIINVGGRKVSPSYVERILEEHPHVAEAAVFALADPGGNVRTVAAIVARGAIDWASLARHAQERLDVLAPWHYHEASSLPRNTMGKLVRKEIPALAEGPLRHPR
ncbi:MAG TPA: class I adenylate-forming enzyme family protein [Usitatibacter sp.]|nr:class I adenylate-forming enzyme family protein [Usitatibacter sp.]